MKSWYESFKPRSSSRFQLLLAGAMWTVVGGGLAFFGLRWTREGSSAALLPALLAAAFLVGAAKARFLLDRTARRTIARIQERGDGRCACGFLSLRSWLLVLVMILAGRLLRSGPLSPALIGILYVAVGTALVISSRLAWRAWLASKGETA